MLCRFGEVRRDHSAVTGRQADRPLITICGRSSSRRTSSSFRPPRKGSVRSDRRPRVVLSAHRQISDDGDHANHMRISIEFLTGRDPNKDAARLIKEQWDLYGDLPSRDWLG